MKKILSMLLLMSFAILVNAQERGQSIMFQDKANEYEHLTTESKGMVESQGEQCMELSRQIEQLKGKPQRRHALMQRYQLECRESEMKTTPAFE
jgi:hypothetical protein